MRCVDWRTGWAVAATLLVAGPGATSPADPGRNDYLVLGAAGASLAANGYDLIDDYGAGATLRLTAAEAASLAAEGLVVRPLDHTTGRGLYRYDPLVDDPVPSHLRAAPSTPYVMVQYRGPVKPEWTEALRGSVDAVYDYLPHYTFLVRARPGATSALEALPGVRAVEPYHPGLKLSPTSPTKGLVAATAVAYLEAPLETVLASLRQAGAVPTAWTTAQLEHVVDVTVDASLLPVLARVESVAWIEGAYDEGGLDNDQASAITQGGATGAWPVHARGVDGSSQKASVCDTGANTDRIVATPPQPFVRMVHEAHEDPNVPDALVAYNAHLVPVEVPWDHRKVDLYYSPQEGGNRGDNDDADGHGTHTSATLAGDKAPYGTREGFDGVAYGAQLLVCDITTGFAFHILNDYANYWDPAYERGARVNSNSWGSTHTNDYTEKARQHDAYVWTHRDFIVVRSMGNTGQFGSMRPEAAAKSVLAVGATENGLGLDSLYVSSTGGPAADGRIKPSVVAPGACVNSAYLDAAAAYVCASGTSHSTPLVAGAATLVRDYFAKGYYPSGAANPPDARAVSSALVRAVILVSGHEIGDDRGEGGFPNKAQGWGRVLLEHALHFAGDAGRLLVLEDEANPLVTGDEWNATVNVTAGQSLRVMLAWSDHTGAAGANPALVNDLDLVVTGPDGETYHGNAFAGNEVPPDQGAADQINVEEAVYVTAPGAGNYTIQVSGTNVPMGPQPFALVATGDVSGP